MSKKVNKKPKIIVILGQTATGKSDLAVEIALKINKPLGCEIISADSRQVYKYLNIGTGKITKKEMRGVPHHLLSVAHPEQNFSVVDFKNLTEKKIKQILKRNKVPIICGGTGFYIDSITKNFILPEVKANPKLRKKLSKKTNQELFELLCKLDKDRAEDIKNKNETNNKVRLIRAIEIAQSLGSVPKIFKNTSPYDFIKIGVKLKEKELEEKIKKRVNRMFQKENKGGLLKEVERIKKMVSEEKMKEFGFEYWNPTEESVIKATIKYAKRQNTWFKKDKEIKWFNPKDKEKIIKYITQKL